MRARPIPPSRLHALCLTLAALALVFQTLIPAGFMPGAASDRPLALVICTGHGPLTSVLDLGGSKAPPHKPAAACVFAGHGAAASPPLAGPAQEAPWQAVETVAPRPTARVFFGRGPAAPPPARGPPARLV